MLIDNIVYSDEIGAAALTVALLPYISDQIAKERGFNSMYDIAVSVYLDLVDTFSRVTSTEKK